MTTPPDTHTTDAFGDDHDADSTPTARPLVAPDTAYRCGRGRVVRGVPILLLLLAASVVFAGPAQAQTLAFNPLDGVLPTFDFLGPVFNETWKRVAGSIWAGCVAAAVIGMATAAVRVRNARKGGYGNDLTDATADFRAATTALGLLAGLAIIVGAVFFVIGS